MDYPCRGMADAWARSSGDTGIMQAWVPISAEEDAMASATVTRPDLFPNGTSVAAYPVANQSEHGRGAAADDTKTVASDQAAFSTLVEGRSYVLVGNNGKSLRFRTVEATVGNAAAALVPSWRARRRALGLV